MKLDRYGNGPILKPSTNEWENRGVFNPAVYTYNGNTCLIYRAQGNDEISRLGYAKLTGIAEVVERSAEPIFSPDPDSEYEGLGIEDPRITKIDDDYYMTYVAASKYPTLVRKPLYPRERDWRVRVSLAKTHDFKSWSRYGIVIGHIDSKDAALFPDRFDGGLCLLHRVVPQIRIAISPDSKHFEERGPVFGPRTGTWDEWRVGMGAPPIKCPYGWILFYHGVDNQKVYRLGLALLDLDDPSLIIARTAEPILEPEEDWEKQGRVNNVVFTCGAAEDEESYWVYYGGADTAIGVAGIEKNIVWTWAKEELSKSRFHEFEKIGNIANEETEERNIKLSIAG
jgi:beta-1,2-mannobiose phosphorylase / 1,2-beta-oligomannan phosphorylase